jgi:hypothetical protein
MKRWLPAELPIQPNGAARCKITLIAKLEKMRPR